MISIPLRGAPAPGSAAAARPAAAGRGAALFTLALATCFLASLAPLAYTVGGIYVASIDGPLLLMVLVYLHARPSGRPRLVGRADPLDGLLLAFLWMAALATVYSLHRVNSANALLDLLRYAVAYLVLRRAVAEGMVGFRTVARMIACLWLLEVGVGMTQYLTNSPIGVVSSYFGDPGSMLSWFEYEQEVSYERVLRVSGTHYIGPDYACWLVMFALVMSMDLLTTRLGSVWRLSLVALVQGVTLLMVVASLSRGVILFQAVALAVLYLAWAREHRRDAAMLACMTGAIVLVLLSLLLATNSTSPLAEIALFKRGLEGEQRGLLAEMALQLFRFPRTWIVGVGPDAIFPAALAYGVDLSMLAVYGTIDLAQLSSGTHNFFLDNFIGGGLVLGCLGLGIAGVIIARAWRHYWSAETPDERIVAAGLLAFWIAGMIPFSLQNDFLSPPTAMFILLFLAWLPHGGRRRMAASST